MMQKMIGYAAAMLLLPLAAGAADLSLGVGVSGSSGVYRDYDAGTRVLPLVRYQGEHLFVDGPTAGVRLYQNGPWTASVVAGLDLNHFDPADATTDAFRQLDERKSGVLAGARLDYRLDVQNKLTAEVLGDVSNHHRATLAGVGLEHGFAASTRQTQYFAYARARYNPARYNNYYYGVSTRESARSGVQAYKAGASVQGDAGLGVVHAFTPYIAMTALAGVRHIGSKLRDSPLVDKATSLYGMLGLSYRF